MDSPKWEDLINVKEDVNYKIMEIVKKHNSDFAFPATISISAAKLTLKTNRKNMITTTHDYSLRFRLMQQLLLEHPIKVDKAASALIIGGLGWASITLLQELTHTLELSEIGHHIGRHC